jgi:hypothetical protein
MNKKAKHNRVAIFTAFLLLAAGALHAATQWYAVCESGHLFWTGSDRSSYGDASRDAVAHDKETHGGAKTAAVLSH